MGRQGLDGDQPVPKTKSYWGMGLLVPIRAIPLPPPTAAAAFHGRMSIEILGAASRPTGGKPCPTVVGYTPWRHKTLQLRLLPKKPLIPMFAEPPSIPTTTGVDAGDEAAEP